MSAEDCFNFSSRRNIFVNFTGKVFMLVHSVFFWLKDDVSQQKKDFFVSQLETLKQITSAREVFTGAPADTDRPVVERSYNYALTVIFDDMTAHDKYQSDPIHKNFISNCSEMFAKVVVYDAQ